MKSQEVEDPAKTVAVFEAEAFGPNASGGSEWFSLRHWKTGFVATVDGSAIRVGEYNREKIRWRP